MEDLDLFGNSDPKFDSVQFSESNDELPEGQDDDFIPVPEPEKIMALSADETKLEIVDEPAKPSAVKEETQPALFEKGEWWEEHWKGMPEFKQDDLSPFKSIYVHFETREDMEKFSQLIKQNINLTTKSIWWPEAEIDEVAKLRWISDPEIAKKLAVDMKKQELERILNGE